jgi:hypothetical protein
MCPWLGFDPLSLDPARSLGRETSASNPIDKIAAAIKDSRAATSTPRRRQQRKSTQSRVVACGTKLTSETESECPLAFAGTGFLVLRRAANGYSKFPISPRVIAGF